MKTLLLTLSIFLGSMASAAPDQVKTADEFLGEVGLPLSLRMNPVFKLTFAQAQVHLAQFPPMARIEIPTADDAYRVCREAGFQGWFYWSSCVADLTGKIFSEAALQAGVQIAKSSNYGPLAETMRAVANQYIDDAAYQAISSAILPDTLPGLLVVLAGARFETDLVPSCNPRANPVGNIVHPLGNSRTLNQKNILQCLYTLRDVRLDSLSAKAKFAKCRVYPDLLSRTECFRAAAK